jgi:hypothetical protein
VWKLLRNYIVVPNIQHLWKDISKQNDIGNQRKIGRRTCRSFNILKKKGDHISNFWNKTVG